MEVVGITDAGESVESKLASVGAGSLVGFPILLAIGVPPLVANTSNCAGLVPGGLSGSWGYRRELAPVRPLALRVAVLSANAAATVVFVLVGPLDWGVVTLLVVGSIAGGWLGAHVGRRLPSGLFRALVVRFGFAVGVRLLFASLASSVTPAPTLARCSPRR